MATAGFVAEWEGDTLTMWIKARPKSFAVQPPNSRGVCVINASGDYKLPPIVGVRIHGLSSEEWTWVKISDALSSVIGRGDAQTGNPVWIAAHANSAFMSKKYESFYNRKML